MKKTALIVDDDPASLRLYRLLLEEAGIAVIEARNGLEALRLAYETAPDLIVTDIRLPVISGLDVVRRIRRDPSLHHVAIIIITAVATREHSRLSRAAGADAHLLKPISVLPFLETVRRCLAPLRLADHG